MTIRILDELERHTIDDEDPWGDRHAQLTQKALPVLIRVARAAERVRERARDAKGSYAEAEAWLDLGVALQELRDMGGEG